ncbi:MAG: hypothetical protein SGI77_15365 [Pirellulaceae bacterium]|nr:hypothetical protein [Pirellulaceae bacterium]
MASYYGLAVQVDRFLVGDSFLLKRSVVDKIGVMDIGYRHFFGDIDYGLRAQRAGFKLVCAKGAWLYHEGSGHARDPHTGKKDSRDEIVQLTADAVTRFCQKWDPSLPLERQSAETLDYERLRDLQSADLVEYNPPLVIDPTIVQILE